MLGREVRGYRRLVALLAIVWPSFTASKTLHSISTKCGAFKNFLGKNNRRGLFQLSHYHLYFLFTLRLSDIGFVQLVVNIETSSQATTIYRLPVNYKF